MTPLMSNTTPVQYVDKTAVEDEVRDFYIQRTREIEQAGREVPVRDVNAEFVDSCDLMRTAIEAENDCVRKSRARTFTFYNCKWLGEFRGNRD